MNLQYCKRGIQLGLSRVAMMIIILDQAGVSKLLENETPDDHQTREIHNSTARRMSWSMLIALLAD